MKPGIVAYACNPSTQETGRSPVQGQPGLQSETLSQKQINNKKI